MLFGRRFKLGAYQLRAATGKDRRLRWRCSPGSRILQAPQPGGPRPRLRREQRLGDAADEPVYRRRASHPISAPSSRAPTTASGAGSHWDNTDIRYANETKFDQDLTLLWGIDLNNSPTVQDVWNTTPAWRLSVSSPRPWRRPRRPDPLSSRSSGSRCSGLAATPGWTTCSIPSSADTARSRSRRRRRSASVRRARARSPASRPIGGSWPKRHRHHSLEIGTFGLSGAGLSDGAVASRDGLFTDVGIDAQYQFLGDPNMVTRARRLDPREPQYAGEPAARPGQQQRRHIAVAERLGLPTSTTRPGA